MLNASSGIRIAVEAMMMVGKTEEAVEVVSLLDEGRGVMETRSLS